MIVIPVLILTTIILVGCGRNCERSYEFNEIWEFELTPHYFWTAAGTVERPFGYIFLSVRYILRNTTCEARIFTGCNRVEYGDFVLRLWFGNTVSTASATTFDDSVWGILIQSSNTTSGRVSFALPNEVLHEQPEFIFEIMPRNNLHAEPVFMQKLNPISN